MKQKDIALVLVVAIVSVIISIFASKAIFSGSLKPQQVVVTKPLSSEFPIPDSHYFNAQANDPTILITIGGSTNSNPFSNNTQ